MEISNKFNLGDVVYYPAADLRMAKIFKSAVSGIVVTEIDGKVETIYQTGQSYGVSAEDMFRTAKPAKRRLLKILQEKKKDIAKDLDKAMKTIDATKTDELVYDLTEKEDDTTETPEEIS